MALGEREKDTRKEKGPLMAYSMGVLIRFCVYSSFLAYRNQFHSRTILFKTRGELRRHVPLLETFSSINYRQQSCSQK